jgi:DNA-binding NtrC family response regulator
MQESHREQTRDREDHDMEEALPLLIVESYQDMRTLLQHFFARQRVAVQTVPSVAVAIAYLAQHLVQVVLTDLFLPDEAGIALVRHVQTTAPETRVIVMGAFSALGTQQKAMAAGAYTFLEKPFPLARLGAKVQHALQDKRGQ